MKEKWYKKGEIIYIEIPYWSKRFNPYMIKENGEPEDVGEFQTLTGLIIKHRKDGNYWEELGFAYTIDMDYKDKGDQYTDIVFHYYGEEEEFKKLCKEWEIPIVELNDNLEEE